jgi:hypothetical protein
MESLTILWTSDNPQTAVDMIEMYGKNAKIKGWFDDVQVIIWGGSNQLIKDNEDAKNAVVRMIEAHITVRACRACSDKLDTTELLESLGVVTEYIGKPFTEIIKDPDQYLITV